MNTMLWLELGSLIACLTAITMLARVEPALTVRSGLRGLPFAPEDADEEESVSPVSTTRERRIARWLIAWSLPCLVASLLSVHLGNHLSHKLNWNPAMGELLGASSVMAIILSLCIIRTQYSSREVPRIEWLRAGLRSFRRVADLATQLGHAVLRPLGIIPLPPQKVTEEEIKTLVELGEEEGILPAGERDLIQSIFELGDTLVREIMIPRTDVVALPADAVLTDALQLFDTSGLSRIPIYEGTIDNIVGVLFLKDIFGPIGSEGMNVSVREFARQPLFIPESKRGDELFREMRAKRMHIAIVVDEFGGTAGIATIEDILEEMVGEIVDEHDRQTYGAFRKLDDRTYIVDARAHVEEVMESLSLVIPPGDYDTVGGFFLGQIERLPTVGDTVETEDAIYVVDQMRGRRIVRLRIIRKETEPTA